MNNFQTRVRSSELGRYAAVPKNLYKLSHCKILSPLEFLIFQYIFSEMYLLGKYKAHFSLNHIVKVLSLSKRTVQRAMKRFDEDLGWLKPISKPSIYGQAYVLDMDALKAKLEALEWGVSLSWVKGITHDSESLTHDSQSFTHDSQSSTHDNLTTNIRVIRDYIFSLKGNIIDASRLKSIESDVKRLLQNGFSVQNILTAIDTISDLSKVKSLYGLVSSFGVEHLNDLETEMTAQRLAREAKRKETAEAVERAKNWKPEVNSNLEHGTPANVPTFKIKQ